MQVHKNMEDLPVFRNAVVTIGTFDGVHAGHRVIIDSLVKEARNIDGESVVITFHPHPRKVVSSTILGIRLINTPSEKAELLKKAGVDHLVIVPFTDLFANQLAEDYIREFLVARFNPKVLIIGYDHRFGRDRQGDFRLLEKMAPQLGIQLKEIPKHLIDEISISSTNIREAILHGDMTLANKLLGYEFFFEGEVVTGEQLGRKLGYPTANLKVHDPEKIIPGDGIYAVYARLESDRSHRKGMMSIGFRPTVDGRHRVIEVNIFDFSEFIYGQKLRVYVKKFLRPEKKFDDLPSLVSQMDQDKIDSLAVL